MTNDSLKDAIYWSEQLTRIYNRLAPLEKKLHQIPVPELDYEERYVLHNELLDLGINVRFLAEALANVEPKKPSIFKRLTHKF